jgi:hypothetical protein
VPNKRTREVVEKLAALRCDPIAGMARIAMNRKNPVELRARMFHWLNMWRRSARLWSTRAMTA